MTQNDHTKYAAYVFIIPPAAPSILTSRSFDILFIRFLPLSPPLIPLSPPLIPLCPPLSRFLLFLLPLSMPLAYVYPIFRFM